MKKSRIISRKELLERAARYSFLGVLGSLAGYLALKNIFKTEKCRKYDSCETCKDSSNCSLATKEEFKKKWKGRG